MKEFVNFARRTCYFTLTRQLDRPLDFFDFQILIIGQRGRWILMPHLALDDVDRRFCQMPL